LSLGLVGDYQENHKADGDYCYGYYECHHAR
jgi:hypothetical protein